MDGARLSNSRTGATASTSPVAEQFGFVTRTERAVPRAFTRPRWSAFTSGTKSGTWGSMRWSAAFENTATPRRASSDSI